MTVETPMPSSMRIGNHRFRVAHVPIDNSGGPRLYGRTLHGQARIEIDPRTAVAVSQKRDTLVHETLHAIINDTCLDLGDEEEEKVIRAITPGLVQVLRGNPQFVAYLTEK